MSSSSLISPSPYVGRRRRERKKERKKKRPRGAAENAEKGFLSPFHPILHVFPFSSPRLRVTYNSPSRQRLPAVLKP
jgi:hypothetical protein